MWKNIVNKQSWSITIVITKINEIKTIVFFKGESIEKQKNKINVSKINKIERIKRNKIVWFRIKK